MLACVHILFINVGLRSICLCRIHDNSVERSSDSPFLTISPLHLWRWCPSSAQSGRKEPTTAKANVKSTSLMSLSLACHALQSVHCRLFKIPVRMQHLGLRQSTRAFWAPKFCAHHGILRQSAARNRTDTFRDSLCLAWHALRSAHCKQF